MKILCPTDYSEHASIAIDYSINLANALEAELHLIYVYSAPSSSSYLPSVSLNNQKLAMQKLVSGVGSILKSDRLPVTDIIPGDTVKSILRYAEEHDVDLIVMGTQGSNSLRTLLFGSTTRKVMENATLPVLAIPFSSKHRLNTNKMLLALDNQIIDKEILFKVPLAIADKYNMKIDIIHIEKEPEMFPFDPFISAHLNDKMGEVILINGSDALQEIKSYVEKNHIGLLIMIRREKSFLSKLLSIGNTTSELANTNTPLLVLPE